MNSGSWFGRLTRPVTVKEGQNGAKQCFFTLACDKRGARRIEQLNQQDGGHRQTADFIPCSIFGYGANNGRPANNNRVDAIANNVHKGDLFGVTGPINTWSKQRPDKTYEDHWSVRVQSFQFGGNNSNHSSNGGVSHGQKKVSNPFANPKPSAKGSAPTNPSSAPQDNNSNPAPKSSKPSNPSGSKILKGGKKKDISDDDLPF